MAVPAAADPAAISEAKQEASALVRQIDKLNDDLEAAVEDYDYATAKLAQTQKNIEVNQRLLNKAEQDLGTAQARLNRRVVGIYRAGRLGFLDILFSAHSLPEFLNRLTLLSRLGLQDKDILDQITVYRAKVSGQRQQLLVDQKEETKLVSEAKAAKATLQTKLKQRQQALKGKEKEIAKLEAEEAARQARLQAEAKAAARARANAYSASGKSAVPVANVPTSRTGASAVEIALRYLGVPYVWGGASPSGFDCSGLVMYVYAKLGVNLPHSSQMQVHYGVPVSRSQLQPGDLVFFGASIHHVGIYIGGGNMIHAPHTGAVVRINSVDRSDYAAARRLF